MTALSLPESWRRRALVLRETTIVLDWFDAEELAEANALSLPKRRAEWLLSRAAAKALAVDLGLGAAPAACHVADRRIALSFVSLSHSAPYAAAAIDSLPVGVDVQVVRSLDERAAHLFMTEEETAAMRRSTLPDRLIHFWAAKEAVWKQLGGSSVTLKRVPLIFEGETERGLSFDSVETYRADDVVVALTRPTF